MSLPSRAPIPLPVLLAGALAALAAAALAAGPPVGDEPSPPESYAYPEHGLTLAAPPLAEVTHKDRITPEMLGIWSGTYGELKVQVKLAALDRTKHGFNEPEDLLDHVAGAVSKIPNYRFRDVELRRGPYGYAEYVAIAGAPLRSGTRTIGENLLLAGILETRAYYLWIATTPPPSDEQRAELRAWLEEAIEYEGPTRDHEWSDEEALARWVRDAPEGMNDEKGLERVIRTDHYIVLTNSSGGRLFAKKMEECYRTVKRIFPFEDVKGRSLMPVFLFQLPEEYYAFCQKQFGWSRDQAAKSKGVASGDFYATWYEAPNDPVHVHEATHQIFANRLRLGGGGSWFQEGVAEFVSEPANNVRNYAKHHAKRGTQTPFREFFRIESMLYSARSDRSGGSQASDNYTQAASIIAFVEDSRFGRKKFQEFVHELGAVPRNDLEAIEAVLNKVFGVDIEGFEAAWLEYWQDA